MPAGTMTARRAVLRWLVMPAVLISLAAGLGSVLPAPHAVADAARADRIARLAGGAGKPVHRLCHQPRLGTVTPIATATNTAGPPITAGSGPCTSRSRRTARPPTSPTAGLGHGDPDRDRHQHRGPPITVGNGPDAIAITPDGKTAYVANATARAR